MNVKIFYQQSLYSLLVENISFCCTLYNFLKFNLTFVLRIIETRTDYVPQSCQLNEIYQLNNNIIIGFRVIIFHMTCTLLRYLHIYVYTFAVLWSSLILITKVVESRKILY